MQWCCGESMLWIPGIGEPRRPLRRTRAPLEVGVDRFVRSALKTAGVWWGLQEGWAEQSSRSPTAWCCPSPHAKCQASRWATVIPAVSPWGTFNLEGCVVNNREPKKGADCAEEPSQVEISNEKVLWLLKIQNLNKIYLTLSFSHRVLLECPVALHPKRKKKKKKSKAKSAGTYFLQCTHSKWVSPSKWNTAQKQQIRSPAREKTQRSLHSWVTYLFK